MLDLSALPSLATQRTFDGFYSTDDVSLAFPREFDVLDGPNMPVPGGWQVRAAPHLHENSTVEL